MKNEYTADIEYFNPPEVERSKRSKTETPPPRGLLESLDIHIDFDRYPQTKVREIHIKDVSIELESK
jgi:hypothetical protein